MNNTRDTILQVANDLFIRQGYTATSIRQIAEQVGIGKATVYHHFCDKQAIILALLGQGPQDQTRILSAVHLETNPLRRIEVAVENSVRFLFENMDLIQVARRELPGGREQINSLYYPFLREFRSLLAETIQLGIDQGLLRPINPADGAQVLMTMIQGTFAISYLSGERPDSTGQVSAALLDVFFHGILKG